MANSALYVKHIETYVESSSTEAQQAASIYEVASLVKNDLLTIGGLVREMEMYLTTTDSIIRARGVLFLGELLTRLSSKPLEDTAIRSLVGFFTERLADWRALQGALVGCLALLRRTVDFGMVSDTDAKAVAQSYLQNLQVQSLGQHDRKLCFQLLECLLDRYPDAIVSLGDMLLYGICEAIDGEKDPQCLMLSFRVIQVLVGLFPDSGPLAEIAEELFELLGCYYPIHFTHPKSEDIDVKREELSRALMLAFASTPLFEPFSIPLLLEKLSSSLPSAKIESFRYLTYCTSKYGADRMGKHAEALWSSLKHSLYISPQTVLLEQSDPTGGMCFQDSEFTTQAFLLLQEVLRNDNGSFFSKMIGDQDINIFMNSLTELQNFTDIATEMKQRLHAIGRILSIGAKSSVASCNKIFQSFFPSLIKALGLSVQNPSGVNFGALYLSIELLDACRSLVLGVDKLSSQADFANEAWCCMLQSFCVQLYNSFISALGASNAENISNAYVFYGVKGLQNLAMFPEDFFPLSIYKDILLKLMVILTSNFDKTFLWKSTLTALGQIGLFVSELHEQEKAASFERIVVESMVSLLSSDDHPMPVAPKLQAICEIGMTCQNFAQKLLQGLEDVLSSKLLEVYVHGNLRSIDMTVKLLECCSSTLLPWWHEGGGSEEVQVNFAANIWDKIQNTEFSSFDFQENELLGATMTAMKQIVRSCSQKSQDLIIHKALAVVSSINLSSWGAKASGTTICEPEGLRVGHCRDGFSCRDKWITSVFASVIIALRPQTFIPNIRLIFQLFVTTLHYGHIPSAHALGSLVNKLPLRTDISEECCLDEAMDIIFSSCILKFCYNDTARINDDSCGRQNTPSCAPDQVHAIVGLAWIGKGLLMRGHEGIKDVVVALVSCILLDDRLGVEKDDKEQELIPLMRSAADAFQILMGESELCLNKKYHATIRPLYKQRFFNAILPILLSSIQKTESPIVRSMMYRALAHVVSDTPFSAVLSEAQKLIPILLDCLSMLSNDSANNDILYNVLLVISGMLTDKNGKEAVVQNAHIIVKQLISLATYQPAMVIRETAIQCLVAMSELPHATIYPFRPQVLGAITKALDDPKRIVRQEAVKCRQAWASMASRSLHF